MVPPVVAVMGGDGVVVVGGWRGKNIVVEGHDGGSVRISVRI